jgi:hypothetical protein
VILENREEIPKNTVGISFRPPQIPTHPQNNQYQ